MRWALLLLLTLAASRAQAHDQWLEAEPFVLEPKAVSVLHHHSGDHFTSEEELPWLPDRASRLVQIDRHRTIDLLARLPAPRVKPIVALRFEDPGTHLVVLDKKAGSSILEAEKFERYLAEEEQHEAIAERRKRGESSRFGRERYTRHLKALLQVGPQADPVATRTVGQTLELVPLANPYSTGKGTRLPVKLLFEGRPLANARVVAHLRGGGHAEALRTAEDGTVEVSLHRSGTWMIRAVYLRRCKTACEEHDWESFWSSLTFAVR